MADAGSVSFTYDQDGKTEIGQISVTVEGIDLDDTLNLLVTALEASKDPAYTVTRAIVTETVTRDKRGPSVRKGRVGGQTVDVPAEGRAARRATTMQVPAVTLVDSPVSPLPGVLDA